MKKHHVLSAALIALISASAAHADAYQQAVPASDSVVFLNAPKPFTWSGIYFGVQGSSHISDKTLLDTVAPSDAKEDDKDADSKTKKFFKGLLNSVAPSVYAGYNFDLGNGIIVGAEGDYRYSFAKPLHFVDANKVETDVSEKWAASGRARLGFALGTILPFATGGLTYSSTEFGKDEATKTNVSYLGYTAGGGIDFALKENIVLRGEYRYNSSFKKLSDSGTTAGADKFSTTSQDVNVGIGFKF